MPIVNIFCHIFVLCYDFVDNFSAILLIDKITKFPYTKSMEGIYRYLKSKL